MAPVHPGLHFLKTLKAFLCHFISSELPVTTLSFFRSEIAVCVLCFLIIQSASVGFGEVSFAIVTSLPGSVVQQWEETESNTPRKIRTSTFANELAASQCTEACRYYWHAEVQTKRLNGGGGVEQENVSLRISQPDDLLEISHIIISAAFRKWSNTTVGINGNPKSRFALPALWEKMTCRRREPEDNVQTGRDEVRIPEYQI